MQTKTTETCGGFDHEKKTMLADKAVANKTTANSRNSTRTWRRVHGDWFPGCSSSTESRAREALSGLLTGSGYCGPWGSTIQRSTLTFFSMSSIMRSMRQISCSMMPCSWISRPAAGTWLSAWFRSGRLSARAATSLPPPVIPPPPKKVCFYLYCDEMHEVKLCRDLPWKPFCTSLLPPSSEKMALILKTLHMSTWKSSRLEENATQRSSISLRCSSGRLLSRRCKVRCWQMETDNFWAFSLVCRSSSRSCRLSVHPPTHDAKCL